MRKWGILISVFYTLILLALIVPGATLLALYKFEGWGKLLETVTEAYGDWMLSLLIAAVLTSQALLLSYRWTLPRSGSSPAPIFSFPSPSARFSSPFFPRHQRPLPLQEAPRLLPPAPIP